MGIHSSRDFGSSGIAGFGGPPLLILGDNADRRARAARLATDFSQRPAELADDALSAIEVRLRSQASARAIWLSLSTGCDPAALDRVIGALDDVAGDRGWPAVVEIPASLIDPIDARLTAKVQLLVDPDDQERLAGMAVLLSGLRDGEVLHDVTSEPSSARLRQLSDEVGRIASTLARLSAVPAAAIEKPVDANSDMPPLTGETVQSVIRARRLRERYFNADLFADPAWDMLLDLLQSEIAQHRVPVSSLCIAAAVPATTALRWIKSLSDAGLFVRRPDPHDGRRVFIELAPSASRALRLYFAEVGAGAIGI
jgi:DNA-binding MarR family transcriptional regulator